MATADEASTPDTPAVRQPRQARELRSEQEIRATHTPEAADLLIAVRRLLVGRFTAKSCLQQLAELLRNEIKADQPGRKSRTIAKRLSEQMSARSKRGPDARMISEVLRHCVSDDDQPAETARLARLFEAAHGRPLPVPDGTQEQPSAGDADNDVRALRLTRAELHETQALLSETLAELRQVRREHDVLAQDQATALRAAGNLTTRAAELEKQLKLVNGRVHDLGTRKEELEEEITRLRASQFRERAELSEVRERLARLVAFVESQPSFRNIRVTSSALPSTAQSIGLSPVSTAPETVRAVASYLRTRAELGRHQINDIATSTSLSPEVIERTLAAQDLPPYPILAAIGVEVGADVEYLLQAYLRAQDELGYTPAADSGTALSAAWDFPAWEHIVAGFDTTTADEPTPPAPGPPVPPQADVEQLLSKRPEGTRQGRHRPKRDPMDFALIFAVLISALMVFYIALAIARHHV